MGYLVPILLALGSLVLDEVDGLPLVRWPWAVMALVPVPYFLAFIERRCAVSGSFRRAALFSRLVRLSPVILQYLALGLFGWRSSLELWLDTELSILAWPEFALLLALVPFLIYSLAAIDADAWVSSPAGRPRAHLRAFHSRMFFAGLGPIVAYIALASLVGRWDVLRIQVEEIAIWSLAFTVVMGVGFVFCLPFFLRTTWETEPIAAGPQRELLERVAQLAGFRCRELLIWKTGNLMSNAAIVGLLANSRRVFFTDALLRQMGPRQLAAVFAHEIGHAKRHHVPIFIVWALAFFGTVDAILSWAELEQELFELTFLGGALLLWLLAFGWISRRAELEADLYSLELLRDGIGITSALQSVAPASHSRTGWRHFSTADRVEFLERATADPSVGGRLRKQLRSVALLGLVLLASTGVWRLGSLAQDYSFQRTVVDLRLGRYSQAQERAQTLEPGEPGEEPEPLALLLQLARSRDLGDYPSRPEAARHCAELARESLEARDLGSALGWLRLAGLAGDGSAGRAAEALAGVGEKPPPGALGEVDLGPWREPLARALADA